MWHEVRRYTHILIRTEDKNLGPTCISSSTDLQIIYVEEIYLYTYIYTHTFWHTFWTKSSHHLCHHNSHPTIITITTNIPNTTIKNCTTKITITIIATITNITFNTDIIKIIFSKLNSFFSVKDKLTQCLKCVWPRETCYLVTKYSNRMV